MFNNILPWLPRRPILNQNLPLPTSLESVKIPVSRRNLLKLRSPPWHRHLSQLRPAIYAEEQHPLYDPLHWTAPETSLNAQLLQLAERFEIHECGGNGACTFKVLRIIEWSLGDNRRGLYNVLESDDDTHTRNRVVTWMEANGDTPIFSHGEGFTSVTQARASDQPEMDEQQYFGWMRDPGTSGGDIEIAAFAAMYV